MKEHGEGGVCWERGSMKEGGGMREGGSKRKGWDGVWRREGGRA